MYRCSGQIRLRGKLFQAAMNGSQRALEVCASFGLKAPRNQMAMAALSGAALSRL
jgi:hypothetical protein